MTVSDRDGLIARIRQVRRVATARDRPDSRPDDPQPERMQALEARMAQLEQMVEGLQDAVHRESERHARLIGELQNQVQPAVMGAALAKDARERRL
jgi:uncharacterized coiled-coil protein SlyX